jgi:oligoendopeptidase F
MSFDVAGVLRHVPGAMVLFAASTIFSAAQERDRNKIPDQYRWDLTSIYPSDDAWRTAKDKLTSQIPELRKFHGQLGSSAARLADCA